MCQGLSKGFPASGTELTLTAFPLKLGRAPVRAGQVHARWDPRGGPGGSDVRVVWVSEGMVIVRRRRNVLMLTVVLTVTGCGAAGARTPSASTSKSGTALAVGHTSSQTHGSSSKTPSGPCLVPASVATYFSIPGRWPGSWNVPADNSCVLTVADASGTTVATIRTSRPIQAVGTDFLSADQGWLLVNSGTGFGPYTSLYATADEGSTWTTLVSAQAWYSGPGKSGRWTGVDLSFANPEDGWLLASMGPGAGSAPKELLATTDGGATWQVAAASPQLPPAAGTDQNVVMVFTGASTGFIAASNVNAGTFPPAALLFETVDGGKTWHQVPLPPLPPSTDPWRFNALDSLSFSNSEVGRVTYTYSDLNNDQATYCYSTYDGGSEWSVAACQP